MRTIVSAIIQVLDRKTDAALPPTAARLADSFGATDSAVARFVAARAPAEVNAAGNALQALRGAIDVLAAASTENRRIQRFPAVVVIPPIQALRARYTRVRAAIDIIKGIKEPLGCGLKWRDGHVA